jgi:four helix bundle protein
MRSGTSIGAMVREAINAETSKDFIHKLSVAQKECDETCYWLELLKEASYISEKEFISIYNDATELLKIIRAIIIKSKQKLETNNS